MKFNPYATLVVTGVLMLLTVIVAQVGPNAALLKAGAASVDRDVSRFAARTFTSLDIRNAEQARAETDRATRDSRTRMAALEPQSNRDVPD